MENKQTTNTNVITSFCSAAYNGLMIAVKSMMPALIMAYVIMLFLNITNLMSVIEIVFRPLMAIFGLPGAAVPVLVMAYLTSSGAVGIAVSLFLAGSITPDQAAILLVVIFCLDSTIQYIGRVLGTSGVRSKFYPLFMLVNVFNAVVGMLIMRLILAFI